MQNPERKLKWQIILIILMALFAIWNIVEIVKRPDDLRHYGWLAFAIAAIAFNWTNRKETLKNMKKAGEKENES